MKLFLLSLSLFTSTAFATTWDLDKSHSGIGFSIDHLVISETTGKFEEYTLDVKSSKEDFTDAEFKAVIKTASINTDDVKRDEHLRSPEFFDVKKNSEITFQGKRFEKLKSGAYKVHGDLTMNGVTKAVVWDAKFGGIVKDPWGGTRAGLKITGNLDRYAYNLKYNSVLEAGGLAIGQDVRIVVNLELLKKK